MGLLKGQIIYTQHAVLMLARFQKALLMNDHWGHNCWSDPPVNLVEATLQSYVASRQHDLSNTSRCIPVPDMRKAS